MGTNHLMNKTLFCVVLDVVIPCIFHARSTRRAKPVYPGRRRGGERHGVLGDGLRLQQHADVRHPGARGRTDARHVTCKMHTYNRLVCDFS